MDRAYSILTIKSIDAEQRTIEGIATTPDLDRHGDMIAMSGCSFRNPIPLLLHHDKTQPVGVALLRTATADGIPFVASIPEVAEPGRVRDRVNEAWHSIKAGFLRGVSIAFRVLDNAVEPIPSGGLKFNRTEILELSLVAIPANAAASIRTIKSIDLAGASAHNLSAVADPMTSRARNAPAMTTTEQINQWNNTRAPLVSRMSELMTKSADAGSTLSGDEATEYDGLDAKVKSIDDHLTRLRKLEQSNAAAAVPITAKNVEDAAVQRGGIITVRPNVPKGTAFVRSAMALLRAKGDSMRAVEYAKAWKDSTPEVELMIKAAVAPGTTTDPAWAGVLVQVTNATNEFLELLRPATILGKIPNLRQVPFNTQVPLQTGGGTYGWVGQSAPKPVTRLTLGTTAIGFAKAAGIIVITEELAKLSTPSAEAIVRADMIAGIAQFLDLQFIDPAVVAVAGVNPASVTNGALTTASTDDPIADLGVVLSHFAGAGYSLGGVTLIMSETNAAAMGMTRDAAGNKVFPGMGVAGGTAEGFSVVASNAAGQNVIGLYGPDILYADDGGIAIDVSREASVLMDSAPPAVPDATAVYTSLWQNNLIGLRAERMVNWTRARTPAVRVLTDAGYSFAPGGLAVPGGTATPKPGSTYAAPAKQTK